jgi:general secretion pathway protein K
VRPAEEERGFALLIALWLIVIVSAMSLELGIAARERRRATANVLEGGRATAAADAGIAEIHELLARRLAGSGVVDPWAGSDRFSIDTSDLGLSRYAVHLEDVGAFLHLNRAGEAELRRLLVALRVDAGRADRLAQAVLDWRDPDDLHRARGAELEDYVKAGAAVLPSNRPFDRIGELRHVSGMTAEVYRRVRPHLTLLGTGRVNLNAASLPVLLALPGMTESAAAVILRRRAGSHPIRNLDELANELTTGPRAVLHAGLTELLARADFETREVLARSDGWVEGSPVRVSVLGLFARGGEHVFLTWSRSQ